MKEGMNTETEQSKKTIEKEKNMKRRDERKNRVKTITFMVVEQQKRAKAGPSTPVPPWKNLLIEDHDSNNKQVLLLSLTKPSFSSFNQQVSARKLAATLWEYQHYLPTSAAADAKMRRHDANGVILGHRSNYMADPDQQPATSASSLRRHIAAAASLMQHHPTTMERRSSHALQPVSPASSMEMTPYHQDATPSTSIDIKGRNGGESSFNLKTSTELLKVLNRIWSLEEQHASNLSFIKALKTELHHTRSKVKELVRERKSNLQEIDNLMKQVTEDKQVRKKKKEQDQINAAVKSIKEDERRLRKRSENLHRKLAKELTEAKSSLYNAVKEMEKERKRRDVLEDLCDEFAKGIKEYEQEVHALRQKCDKNWATRADFDGLILHTAESWLDERMQMKLRESQFGDAEQNSVVDKLSWEIATLFKAKEIKSSSVSKDNLIRRRSMESVPLSAPQDDDLNEDEAGSNTNCRFELNNVKLLSDEDSACVTTTNKPAAAASREKVKSHRHPSLQVKFEEEIETADTQKPEIGDKHFHDEGSNNANSNSMIDHQFGSRNMHHPELDLDLDLDLEEGSCYGNSSIWRNRAHASPVQEWKSKLISTHLPDISAAMEESRTKLLHKERNSLKAKLLEARSKGHHSRMKASNK